MTITTTRLLPPFLISWYEHTASARQLSLTLSDPAPQPVTTPALAAEVPIATPVPPVATPDAFPSGMVFLKALLQRRHWQSYSRFCKEYDKAAKAVDPSLVGTYPSRAQHYRWLSGHVTRAPYPHHCEVLEAMFPGYTAAQLMAVIP